MSDPAGTYFDGNHEIPYLVAPPLVSYDETLRSVLTKLRFRVRAPFFRIAARGSLHSRAQGFLVGQAQPKIVGGDLLEYEQLYATTPGRPSEPTPYVYPFQIVFTGSSSGTPELAELPIPVTATASYRYYHTAQPEFIPLARAWKAADLSGSIVWVGSKPAPGATTILAEDESLTRVWPGGDYWEVRTLTVPLRALLTGGA